MDPFHNPYAMNNNLNINNNNNNNNHINHNPANKKSIALDPSAPEIQQLLAKSYRDWSYQNNTWYAPSGTCSYRGLWNNGPVNFGEEIVENLLQEPSTGKIIAEKVHYIGFRANGFFTLPVMKTTEYCEVKTNMPPQPVSKTSEARSYANSNTHPKDYQIKKIAYPNLMTPQNERVLVNDRDDWEEDEEWEEVLSSSSYSTPSPYLSTPTYTPSPSISTPTYTPSPSLSTPTYTPSPSLSTPSPCAPYSPNGFKVPTQTSKIKKPTTPTEDPAKSITRSPLSPTQIDQLKNLFLSDKIQPEDLPQMQILPNNRMCAVWRDGTTYLGGWNGTHAHGWGTWTLPDKTIKKVWCENGKAHGIASVDYPDGTHYQFTYDMGVLVKQMQVQRLHNEDQ